MRDYADYLLGLGLAPSTVRMYRAHMRKCADWADDNGVDLLNPSATDLAALRAEFVESAATLRQLRCALQHYWDYHNVRSVPIRALRVPKKPRPHWRGIPDDDARRLAITAAGWHPEGTATLIALYTGLRRAEIASMRWDRFNPEHTRYTVLGKGSVTDEVPVHPTLRAHLVPHRNGYIWLFPGERKLHVVPNTIWSWIRSVAEEAGIVVTPHQLRHTIISKVAKAAAANGKGPEVPQRFGRHARIDTTQIYIEAATSEDVESVLLGIDWLGPIREAGSG